MDVLHSIAGNDDLQCVPKLICELTSGNEVDIFQCIKIMSVNSNRYNVWTTARLKLTSKYQYGISIKVSSNFIDYSIKINVSF